MYKRTSKKGKKFYPKIKLNKDGFIVSVGSLVSNRNSCIIYIVMLPIIILNHNMEMHLNEGGWHLMVIITLRQPTLSNLLEDAYKTNNQILIRLNINSYEIK